MLEDDEGYNTPLSLLAAGIVATLPGAPVSMPFDVIATRLQVVRLKLRNNFIFLNFRVNEF